MDIDSQKRERRERDSSNYVLSLPSLKANPATFSFHFIGENNISKALLYILHTYSCLCYC
jgi:hypothetical protein